MEDNISTAGATAEDQNASDNQTTSTATDNQNVNQDANLDTSTSTDNTSGGTATTKDDGDSSQSSDKKSDSDNSSTTFDPDLDEWAERTKRPKPTNDRERELYQEIRNTARDMGRQKEAKEALGNVGKAISDNNPTTQNNSSDDSLDLNDTVSQLQRSIQEERALRVRSEFFASKDVSADEATAMGEILKEKVDKAPQSKKQAIYDFWTDPENLGDWHQLAQARLSQGTSADDKLAEEVKRQERARIAKESQAAGGNRNAKSTVTEGEKTDDERRMELWSK